MSKFEEMMDQHGADAEENARGVCSGGGGGGGGGGPDTYKPRYRMIAYEASK